MSLIDFTLSNARRFYSSMGNPLGWKGVNLTVIGLSVVQFKDNPAHNFKSALPYILG